MSLKTLMLCAGLGILVMGNPGPVFPQGVVSSTDAKAEKFLNEQRSNWHDWIM